MTEPTWAKVLSVMYEDRMALDLNESFNQSPQKLQAQNLSDFHWLIRATGEEPEEVEQALRYMDNVNLVSYIPAVGGEEQQLPGVFGLTEKGFDVARERQYKSQQKGMNEKLNQFTAALVAVGLIQAMASAITVQNDQSSLLLLLVILGLSVVLLYYNSKETMD